MARVDGPFKDWQTPGLHLYPGIMSKTPSAFRDVRTPQSKAGDAPASTPVETPRLDPRAAAADLPPECGGYAGPEPTRFGDWEHKGRCTDF